VTQIEGWRLAQHKLPSWAANDDITFPPRLAMEQCSSEATARYKASLTGTTPGGAHHTTRLTDLTGGLGVDCAFMAGGFDEVTYVERNAALCATATRNFEVLGLTQIRTVNDDGTRLLTQLARQDWIYLDPARRDAGGRKVVFLADCEPDVTALEQQLLEHAERVMVKCSPMLDIRQALRQLQHVDEVHVVAVQNECKELLFVLSSQHDDVTLHAVSVGSDGSVENDFTFTLAEEQGCCPPYADAVGRWLYEPGAALLKAGCFKLPAARYGLRKLHPNSQLYTSDMLVGDFAGRTFEVTGATGFGKRELKALLADVGQANIAVRNFTESVDTLRRRLRIAEGGDDYLFATTLNNGQKLLIRCRKVQQ